MLWNFGQISQKCKTNRVIYLKETTEQKEGAFSNFRISPVTINKLKGEYESDNFTFSAVHCYSKWPLLQLKNGRMKTA